MQKTVDMENYNTTAVQKKTVATITYHGSDNFGSVLQAYALNKVLIEQGYDSYVIDYRKQEVEQVYQIIKFPQTAFDLVTDIYHLMHYSDLRKRKLRYEQFRKEYINLSQCVYKSHDMLMKRPPNADVYICGSDQVWNPDIVDFDESYLLDFVTSGKKIAYAASGISPKTTDAALFKLEPWIRMFDAVSVRERSARERLQAVLGCKAQVVLDPVLLLSRHEWEKITQEVAIKDDYLLCYFAGGVSAEFEQYTRELARKLHCKRIILMPEWRNFFRRGVYAYDSGPIEFLSLIKQAKAVCTNSFHGTVFSLLFNRPFIVGLHRPFIDDRISTILQMSEMSEREIDVSKPYSFEHILDVDFKKANQIIEKKRADDIRWLCRAVEGVCI